MTSSGLSSDEDFWPAICCEPCELSLLPSAPELSDDLALAEMCGSPVLSEALRRDLLALIDDGDAEPACLGGAAEAPADEQDELEHHASPPSQRPDEPEEEVLLPRMISTPSPTAAVVSRTQAQAAQAPELRPTAAPAAAEPARGPLILRRAAARPRAPTSERERSANFWAALELGKGNGLGTHWQTAPLKRRSFEEDVTEQAVAAEEDAEAGEACGRVWGKPGVDSGTLVTSRPSGSSVGSGIEWIGVRRDALLGVATDTRVSLEVTGVNSTAAARRQKLSIGQHFLHTTVQADRTVSSGSPLPSGLTVLASDLLRGASDRIMRVWLNVDADARSQLTVAQGRLARFNFRLEQVVGDVVVRSVLVPGQFSVRGQAETKPAKRQRTMNVLPLSPEAVTPAMPHNVLQKLLMASK
eukprot:COSAG04_NODE_2041_length_4943_cov_2.912335_1_plen_414_part_00